jgi:hypothetical protein
VEKAPIFVSTLNEMGHVYRPLFAGGFCGPTKLTFLTNLKKNMGFVICMFPIIYSIVYNKLI